VRISGKMNLLARFAPFLWKEAAEKEVAKKEAVEKETIEKEAAEKEAAENPVARVIFITKCSHSYIFRFTC
jgi:hypothetical protein